MTIVKVRRVLVSNLNPGDLLSADEQGRVRRAGKGECVIGRVPLEGELGMKTLPEIEVDETLMVTLNTHVCIAKEGDDT